jgi:hypothetical protein
LDVVELWRVSNSVLGVGSLLGSLSFSAKQKARGEDAPLAEKNRSGLFYSIISKFTVLDLTLPTQRGVLFIFSIGFQYTTYIS